MNVAVVLPIYRNSFTNEESISLNHFNYFLNDYEVVVIKPISLNFFFDKISPSKVINFPDHYFRSVSDYSKLLLRREFYEAFVKYDYILIYQLDCLIFNDKLKHFCKLDYDYIGAPIFQRNRTKPIISRVGNGGFSLRRVQTFLDVLSTQRYIYKPVSFSKELFTVNIPDLVEWPIHKRLIKKIRILRAIRIGVEKYTKRYSLNEDLFWSDRAHLFYPDFKIASIEEGLRFSFDRHPRYCFEKNNQQLPFGCHAWAKWDRGFWEPYLIT
ncbi:MAG TPA: hypothetical protein DCK95_05670 [Anaerolineaceae bacterium]|nr:hypothetical protein [Anaerolineaceae bacterium]